MNHDLHKLAAAVLGRGFERAPAGLPGPAGSSANQLAAGRVIPADTSAHATGEPSLPGRAQRPNPSRARAHATPPDPYKPRGPHLAVPPSDATEGMPRVGHSHQRERGAATCGLPARAENPQRKTEAVMSPMRACHGCGKITPLGTPFCSECRPARDEASPPAGRSRTRVCREIGCPKLTPCPDHGRTEPRWKPYSNARWRKLSIAYRKAHPICERCRLAPSAHVDHKDGRGPDGPLGYTWSNLEALCRSCHSRKTATEDGGFGNARRAA